MFKPEAVGVVVRKEEKAIWYSGVLYASAILEDKVEHGTKLYTQADIDQLIHERDNYRAVLEGAEYRNLDNIGSGSRLNAKHLGQVMARMSKAVIKVAGDEGQRVLLEERLRFTWETEFAQG
jgi:hypothetical protein